MPENDQWSIRIRAARDAQVRSRLAFLASTIVSVALLISIYNSEFSWLRNLAESKPPTADVVELHKEVQKLWIDNSRMEISLLGVNLDADDASLLGSFGLYVLAVWFFYCMRRENHLIANLLIDADKAKHRDVCLSVYHGVASYTVFTTIGGDQPISVVRPAPAQRQSVARIRFINIVLLFLPALAIAIMFGTDVHSLYNHSPLRGDGSLWFNLTGWEQIKVVFIDGVVILLFALTATACAAILKFETATESVLREFHDLLFPRLPQKAI